MESWNRLHTENMTRSKPSFYSNGVFYPIYRLYMFFCKSVVYCTFLSVNESSMCTTFKQNLFNVYMFAYSCVILVLLRSVRVTVGHVRDRKINLKGKSGPSLNDWPAGIFRGSVNRKSLRTVPSEASQRPECNNRHGTRAEQVVLECVGLSCAFSAAPVGHLLISVAELKRITVCVCGEDRY